MKYLVKNKNYEYISDDELLKILLKQRGVENPDKLLKIRKSCLNDAKLFNNIEKGMQIFDKHIKNKSKICIIVDSDCDGYCSASLMYLFIKGLDAGNEVEYIFHDGKQHGITEKISNKLNEIEYDLLIVPDAGSNDTFRSSLIKAEGKDILILDHHEMDEINPYATVINCQDGVYPNRTLSGTGVTFKFCELYEKEILSSNQISHSLLDLVAVGNIGDMMDMRNLETRYLTLKGIEILNSGYCNTFFKAVHEKNKARLGNLNIMKIGWNISPLINAVTRVGTQDEKEDLFKALINSNETKEYQPRRKKGETGKPPIEIQDIQTFMARVVTNIKARQDKMVKKYIDELELKVSDEDKIIIIEANDLEQTFTGLIANKLASTYKRPSIVLRDKSNSTKGGSGRNYKMFEIDNLREFLIDTDEFIHVSGHNNSFGFEIQNDNIKEMKNKVSEKLKEVKIEDVYHVDYAIPMGRLREKHIKQVGKMADMWGNSIDEPLFVITDIYVEQEDIKIIGDKQTLLKITKQVGDSLINFVKISSKEETLNTYNTLLGRNERGLSKKKKGKVGVEIIGKFKINKYEDREYPQIEIVDFNLLKERKIKF